VEAEQALGIDLNIGSKRLVNGVEGSVSKLEVHSVRPVRRIGPDGQQRLDLVVELTQKWDVPGWQGFPFRGGCTLIVDPESASIRYSIRKRIAQPERIQEQQSFAMAGGYSLHANYFTNGRVREPFALIHRSF